MKELENGRNNAMKAYWTFAACCRSLWSDKSNLLNYFWSRAQCQCQREGLNSKLGGVIYFFGIVLSFTLAICIHCSTHKYAPGITTYLWSLWPRRTLWTRKTHLTRWTRETRKALFTLQYRICVKTLLAPLSFLLQIHYISSHNILDFYFIFLKPSKHMPSHQYRLTDTKNIRASTSHFMFDVALEN